MRLHFNSIILLLICAYACAICPAIADSSTQHTINIAKSTAQFTIEHIFVDRVTGTVPILSGSVAIAPGSTIPTSVTAVLDPTRIHTDEPDRDSALKSADYFDTQNFPTWTFRSTKIEATQASVYAMDGTLTIHGVTQPEHLDITVQGDATHPVYHAVGRIDRHAFGMRGARLDPVIGNYAEVTLDIVVE